MYLARWNKLIRSSLGKILVKLSARFEIMEQVDPNRATPKSIKFYSMYSYPVYKKTFCYSITTAP